MVTCIVMSKTIQKLFALIIYCASHVYSIGSYLKCSTHVQRRNTCMNNDINDSQLRDAIHTHFVTLIGKWTISFLPIHPVFLSALSKDVPKIYILI